MNNKIHIALTLLFVTLHIISVAQEIPADTIPHPSMLHFKYTALIMPAVMITYGVVGLESHALQDVNNGVHEEVHENIDRRVTIDDFAQYAPAASVYALNAIGIKGKNSFKDRTIILGTSFLIMTSTVTCLKNVSNVIRPDGSSNNSFPSGHTATAFMGAEFLWQEYKDVSVWYGIAGYAVACGTGFFRVYNDRHWVTDVAAGAGIGILSTKIAYWLHPIMKNKIFKSKTNATASSVVYPYYNGNQIGMGLVYQF